MFFSISLSPTAKYVLISIHIYNLHWTTRSLVFSEVIGLLHRAESTISNTHNLKSSKLPWSKAFISNTSLLRHYVPWVWFVLSLGCYVAVKHVLFCFLLSVVLSKPNFKGFSALFSSECSILESLISFSTLHFSGLFHMTLEGTACLHAKMSSSLLMALDAKASARHPT